ncbi:hypothetical protein AGDE_12811 [Angomonas deanei]|uniref:ATPase family associated with various cellular activities (AAA), putative n=1 Tax=Angomonas deanei TaxID=59799 RepID=A0A7G2CGL2_9TRYP|nr:hypothetical protein AGDE_12811 [Angomonas deanei]CAD2218886.1 ATPase family associated with various cellular activities (AAA), putative [Angomonas deanei]|eukprot:EPY23489.1 hypothetical protein AGDE_12811 [Angomonas deanei]
MESQAALAALLLQSQLKFWPSPAEQTDDSAAVVCCPSFLLAGPSQNGKTFLVEETVRHGFQASNEDNSALLYVKPDLHKALTLKASTNQNTKTNIVRTIVEREVIRQLQQYISTVGLRQDVKYTVSIVVVFDHLELLLGVSENLSSLPNHLRSGEAKNLHMPEHISLFTDFVTFMKGNTNHSFYGEENRIHFDSILRHLSSNHNGISIRSVVLVGVYTGDEIAVPTVLKQSLFDQYYFLETPNGKERESFLERHFSESPHRSEEYKNSESFKKYIQFILLKCGGITYGGLKALAHIASLVWEEYIATHHNHNTEMEDTEIVHCVQTMFQLFLSHSSPHPAVHGEVTLLENYTHVHAYKHAGSYTDVTPVHWADIAGLEEVKQKIKQLFVFPLQHAAYYHAINQNENGPSYHFVQPSTGLLLFGPPGTGKTLLAKAMATELSASFLSINIADLIQSEVGESEKKLDYYFQLAVERSPCIIFMDEMQAAFGSRYGEEEDAMHPPHSNHHHPPNKGSHHESRLVSHFIQLLDRNHRSFSPEQNHHFVLFVGATNVKHHLDPLLLQAGRLDTVIGVPLPSVEARQSLIERVVRHQWTWWTRSNEKKETQEEVQHLLIARFVKNCEGKSGAEIQNCLNQFSTLLVQHVLEATPQEGTASSLAEAMVRSLYTVNPHANTLRLSDLVLHTIIPLVWPVNLPDVLDPATDVLREEWMMA